MTGWIIAGSILLFVLILLLSRATVIADFNGDLCLKVKYFGITIFRIPAKKKKKKKPVKKTDKKSKKEEPEKDGGDDADGREENAKEDKSEEKKKKPKKPLPTFDELMELLRLALDTLGKPLKRILKRVTFSHLDFEAVCGGEDAAKAAVNYGVMNIALSSALNLIDTFFTLKAPDGLRIDVDFYQEKTVIKLYCEVRITVGAALAFAGSLIGRAIKNYFKRRGARSAIKKLTAKSKELKAAQDASK